MLKIYEAEKYGIIPGAEIGRQWNALLASLAAESGEKRVTLAKGEYYIDSDNVPAPLLYITNTIGDGEWKKGEEPHRNRAATYLKDVDNLVIDGNGSVLIMRGSLTNAAISGCKNIEIRNITFRTENPDLHEFAVKKRGLTYVDFELDEESRYEKSGGKYYFTGKDFRTPFTYKMPTVYWIGKIPADNPDKISRVRHPLFGSFSLREIAPRIFRARYPFTGRFRTCDKFYLFDNRRLHNGIFVDSCENVVLSGIEQNFNYGLAVVCQNTAGVTIENCRFAPAHESAKLMASVADFVQISVCRGLFRVCDNFFKGSGDDCLNAHGIHFEITEADDERMNLRFRHSQTHGFCPFREGDELRIINPRTLLQEGQAVVKSARLTDEYNIEIIASGVSRDFKGSVVENASACPDLIFENNTMNRIITRGVLLTTSGKVRIKSNKFLNTAMNSILISDDASSWYESGFVRDVVISDNYFGGCRQYTLQVKPENRVFAGYVHSNIVFENNTAEGGEGGFYIEGSDKVSIKNNRMFGNLRKTVIKNSKVTREAEK